MRRRLVREYVLKILFARDIGKVEPDVILPQMCSEDNINQDGKAIIQSMVEGVIANLTEIDALITSHAIDWNIERMAGVDRNIMRMAIYEMKFVPDVPTAVAANEAIELAKAYGSDESPKFVNGIIGKIVKELPSS